MTAIDWVTQMTHDHATALAELRKKHAAEMAKLRATLTEADMEIGALKYELAKAKGEPWKP